MNNLLQTWKKNGTPIYTVVAELKRMLTDKYWGTYFIVSDQGEQLTYTYTLEYMQRTVHLSRCGYASSIYSEDLALQLIKDALSENIANIAKWLLSDDTSMQIFIVADEIGTVVYKDHTIDEEVPYALMCLRKCDIPCKNASGFFVEYIFPISDI
jgi:hypothetical protein